MFSSYAAGAVGDNFKAGSWGNVFANAMVGGITSSLQGGKFGHGFWAAGMSAWAKGATGVQTTHTVRLDIWKMIGELF